MADRIGEPGETWTAFFPAPLVARKRGQAARPTIAQKGNSKRVARFGGHVRLVPSRTECAAEAGLAATAREHAPPWAPTTRPVRLDVCVVYACPPSWPRALRAAALAGEVVPTGGATHDRGNSLKLLEDALRGSWYADDAQVVAGDVRKKYGTEAGYVLALAVLPGCSPEAWREARRR